MKRVSIPATRSIEELRDISKQQISRFGENSPVLTSTWLELASALQVIPEYAESRLYFEKALENLKDRSTFESVSIREDFARMLMESGKYDEALKCKRETMCVCYAFFIHSFSVERGFGEKTTNNRITSRFLRLNTPRDCLRLSRKSKVH